jgi:hypothetical protein
MASDDALALLRSIDASLKVLVAQSRAAAPPAVASDRDLDSKYGDPVLKFVPRDWRGDDYKGSRYSMCPPELLDLVADTNDYFARQAEAKDERTSSGKPVAPYKRLDAARARGWAARLRSGRPVSAPPPAPGFADDDDFASSSEWS